MKTIIYTDGACIGNPGPGGWGAVLIRDGDIEEISGGDPSTTNNRMELRAAIEALRKVHGQGAIELVTDSQYVRLGITQWIVKWRQNGWRTGAKAEVKNKDLWQELWDLSQGGWVTWRWVKGHSGNEYNERADRLARAEAEKALV